jgi:hypothetical protein
MAASFLPFSFCGVESRSPPSHDAQHQVEHHVMAHCGATAAKLQCTGNELWVNRG